MFLTGQQKLQNFLADWAGFSGKYSIPIILLALVSAIFCANYTIHHISINTDTQDMLSADLEWRKQDTLIDDLFPQYTDNLLVVVEAKSPDEAADAAKSLTNHLQSETTLFKSVFYPAGNEFFQTTALLHLDTDELQDLSDNLARIQPFLGRLTADQSLRGLFNMLNDAIQAKIDGDEIDLQPLVEKINKAFQSLNNNEHYRLSWQALIGNDQLNKPVYREFIILQPNLDYDGLQPAKHAIEKIREISTELNLDPEHHINVRLTGSAALSEDELTSVFNGMEFSVTASLLLVTALLIIGLRTLWYVAAVLFSLVCGLIYTAFFASLAIGELNLISVAFAVLYIGLGVDFAIHFSLRYLDEAGISLDKKQALSATGRLSGEALLLCAVTTLIGFYAFIPTDYVGVAELGLISGTGMIISFIVTMTLIPALLILLPIPKTGKLNLNLSRITKIPVSRHKLIKILTLVLALASIFTITRLEFDHNTLNLQSPDNESVKTFFDLLKDSDTSPWTSVILANNKQQAEELANKMEQQKLVDKVVWLKNFIPDNQDEKLLIIELMDLILGGLSIQETDQQPNIYEQISSLTEFNKTLDKYIATDEASNEIKSLQQYINKYLLQLESKREEDKIRQINQLQTILLQSFPGRLNSLLQAMYAEEVNDASIPPEISSRWKSEGKYRLEIYPVENISDNQAMRKFVNSVREIAPEAVGAPVISIEAGDAVIKAFIQAFSYALSAIVVLLLLLTPRKRDTVFILAPLLLATLFTGAFSVIAGIKLNFANIIALPLLLGIGVDSAIHIVHKYNTSSEHTELLGSSSARAVLLSALTTILSIGNLAFSPHLGTASMGKLLTIGICMTLFCSLVILPALLINKPRK